MTKPESRTIQLWPGGESITYRGDIDGPAKQKRLKGRDETRWRQGTAADWRKVRIEVRAEMYGERDIFGCDSSLVDDLLKLSGSCAGENSDVLQAFSYEEMRNVYADPSDWDEERLKAYADDHDLELPTTIRQTACRRCDADIEGDIFGVEWRDRGNNPQCREEDADETRSVNHEPEDDIDGLQDEWREAAREVCREHAQENPAEPYEWWRVSSWLCDQLHSIGEVTIDNGYGHWWGRQCSGQMWIMDGTLQKVAELFERSEA